MSSKNDKFSSKDKNFMKLALSLASVRKGLTGENPSVGCVVVKDDRIISIGQTGYDGRPHAEHNAINNTSENSDYNTPFMVLKIMETNRCVINETYSDSISKVSFNS